MVKTSCDCDCAKSVTIIGDSTTQRWNHPREGGKYFASPACRLRYLNRVASKCLAPGCEIWLVDGTGHACSEHLAEAAELVASCNAGVPADHSPIFEVRHHLPFK